MTRRRFIEDERILQAIKSNLTLLGAILPQRAIQKQAHKIYYMSSSITTGHRMYDYMTQHKIVQADTIPDGILQKQIMQPNIAESIQASNSLRDSGFPYVIVPGYFIAEGWTQENYLDLWKKVIADYVHVVYFNEKWEYSNGCVTEFLFALQSKKEMLDSEMNPMDGKKGVQKIKDAIVNLRSRGIRPSKLSSLHQEIEFELSARRSAI